MSLIVVVVVIIVIITILILAYYHFNQATPQQPSPPPIPPNPTPPPPAPASGQTLVSATFGLKFHDIPAYQDYYFPLVQNKLNMSVSLQNLSDFSWVSPGIFAFGSFVMAVFKVDVSKFNVTLANYNNKDTGTIAYFGYFTEATLNGSTYTLNLQSNTLKRPYVPFATGLNYGLLRLDNLTAGGTTTQLSSYMNLIGYEDLTVTGTPIFTYDYTVAAGQKPTLSFIPPQYFSTPAKTGSNDPLFQITLNTATPTSTILFNALLNAY
jgi:hypothetical protein